MRLLVRFFKSETGREPVREWLKALSQPDRKVIGNDIKTAHYGWPLGMPLIRKLDKGLWEVRSRLENGIARVIFTVHDGRMILLHGFIKKSQKTPLNELQVARKRLSALEIED